MALETRETPRPSTRRSLVRSVAVALMVLVGASGCTISSGDHYQVDLVATGYHFHIYQNPTTQIWFAHVVWCNNNARCTLDLIHDQLDVNSILETVSNANEFFDDTEDEGDFAAALASVTPVNPSVNEPERFGCLGGYRNTSWWWNDGDWYGDGWNGDWCRLGEPLQ